MNTLTSFLTVGANKGAPRIWIENNRLSRLGFAPGTRLHSNTRGNEITLVPAIDGTRIVSSHRQRPAIDLNSHKLLSAIAGFQEIRVKVSVGRLHIKPSIHAFHIQRAARSIDQVRVLELFAGGGTFASAIRGIEGVTIVGAADKNPTYSHFYDLSHPNTEHLLIGDARRIPVSDYPQFDMLVAGIICSDTSKLGRAKKGLAGAPERGESADLFIPVLSLIASRLPPAVVLENVATYKNDAASSLIRTYLKHLGYHCYETIMDSHNEWGDIQDRKRWCLIATLKQGFNLTAPGVRCTRKVSEFLDAPSAEDRADCAAVSKNVQGLLEKEKLHRQRGNGFRFSVLDPDATKVPTITKSCRKGNLQGPWIQTQFGYRLLRASELARISGHAIHPSASHTVAGEIVGQGGAVRMWALVFRQLVHFLRTK
jgi:DNA (cytosine-5)-methyltransferase 1